MLIVTSIPDPRDLTFGSSKDMHCGAGGMRAGGMRARWHACRAERRHEDLRVFHFRGDTCFVKQFVPVMSLAPL